MSAISREPARLTAVSVNDPDVRVFIGPNADKLVGKLRLLDVDETTGRRARGMKGLRAIVWPAVFLGVVWYLYRRMYFEALAIMVGMLLLEVALDLVRIDLPPAFNSALAIAFGIAGPSFYAAHVKRKVARIRRKTADPRAREEQLRRAGGVDWISPSILLVLAAGVLFWALTVISAPMP